jgi:hypothetical protein
MGEVAYLPDDIKVEFPNTDAVSPERIHLLAYIPWHAEYLGKVPAGYRKFFEKILPLLEARTTNVHTAVCLSLVRPMIDRVGGKVDEQVVHVALTLHDAGWSQLGEEEIANSLDYKGLSHSGVEAEVAQSAKERHDVLGHAMAKQILAEQGLDPELTEEQKELVAAYVRYHTFPRRYSSESELPIELKLVHDTDRLWSYTHENFWHDTVRKDVDPQAYAYNLAMAIEGYFLTEEARVMARELLLEREVEVAALQMHLMAEAKSDARAVFA